MLRVDRGSDHRISIKVREQSRSLSPLFLKAFLVALSLHFLVWILFPIHKWIHSPSTRAAPTTLSFNQNATKTDIQPELRLNDGDWPVWKEPLDLKMKSGYANEYRVNPVEFEFDKKNKALGEDYFEHFTLKAIYPKRAYKKVEMNISGPLAELTVIQKDNRLELTEFIQGMNPKKIVLKFKVLVAGKSGKIFWYNLESISEETPLLPLVIEILNELSFEETSYHFIDGEIEFTILKLLKSDHMIHNHRDRENLSKIESRMCVSLEKSFSLILSS